MAESAQGFPISALGGHGLIPASRAIGARSAVAAIQRFLMACMRQGSPRLPGYGWQHPAFALRYPWWPTGPVCVMLRRREGNSAWERLPIKPTGPIA